MREAMLDMHCHTNFGGHAYSTVKENIDEANRKGMKYLGISEHSLKMPGGPHEYFFQNLKVIPRRVGNVRILRGVEANITDLYGNMDITDSMSERLDYAIASLHRPCIEPGNKEENTRAVINAMDHPLVKIIGHPDDNQYELDYEQVVKNAVEKNVLLEINNSSMIEGTYRVGARDNYLKLLKICKKYGAKVIFGSDAHICYSIGNFENCESVIEEADFPKELVINYHEDQIRKFFGIDF